MVPKGGLDRLSLGDHAIGLMRRGFGLTRSARHRGHSWFTSGMRERSVPAHVGARSRFESPWSTMKRKRSEGFLRRSLDVSWCQRGDSNPHGFPHHPLKQPYPYKTL